MRGEGGNINLLLLKTAAFNVQLTDSLVIQTGQAVLLAAQAAAGIMMGVAFRGFLLWIINVALVCYFFTKTLEITDYNRAQASGPGMDNFGYRGDKNNDPYGFRLVVGEVPNLL